jgi:16S rRNA G966 N2-methylase RsmD
MRKKKKTFDDLFNEFINSKPSINKPIDKTNNEISKINEMLNGFRAVNSFDEYDKLGKPFSIEYFREKELYCRKRMWNTPDGTFVDMIFQDSPFEEDVKPKLTKEEKLNKLNEDLEIAVNNENYMEAAKLRDLIKKQK